MEADGTGIVGRIGQANPICKLLCPIFHGQSGYLAKLSLVIGNYDGVEAQSMCRDLSVQWADRLATAFQVGANVAIGKRSDEVEGCDLQRYKESLQRRSIFYRAAFGDPESEFCDGHAGDAQLTSGETSEALENVYRPLIDDVDTDIGVEQILHGLRRFLFCCAGG